MKRWAILLLLVGVANAFFGWGLMLRLDDPSGVTLTASTR